MFNVRLLDSLNRVSTLYFYAKTSLIYRSFFQSMGHRCIIRRPLLLNNCQYISLGDRVTIREGVRMEAIVSRRDRAPTLSIGNNVNIEQNVHIVCHSRIRIGDNVSITGNCAIVDVTHPYGGDPGQKIGARILDEDSFVEIGEGAFLGYAAVILPNVRIGKKAVIGANSVVTHDVPDYGIAAGNPAKLLKICQP